MYNYFYPDNGQYVETVNKWEQNVRSTGRKVTEIERFLKIFNT